MQRLNTPFLRYCLIGAGGLVIDAAALALLMRLLSLDPYSARVGSILIALTVTWFLHRRITFRTRGSKRLREWFRFLLVNGVGGLTNYGVYSVLVYAVPQLTVLGALIAGSVVALAVNYWGSRHFAFRGGSQ